MYTVADYGDMIADKERMRAYVGALERVVKPGSVVLDLGAGTGIFSLYACKFGASRVYAIEPNRAITLLPELARRNGFGDRIQVFAKKSSEVTLPEKVDVIVSDLRGASPLFNNHLSIVRDARERFLREGGVLLPERDTLMACLISAPEAYERLVGPWQDTGFDLSPCVDEVLNWAGTDHKTPFLPEHCVSAPRAWATIEYGTRTDDRASGSVVLRANHDVEVHGIATWFRASIWGDFGFENAPGNSMVYRRYFLAWPKPVFMRAGVEARIKLDALPGSDDYMFAWATEITQESGLLRFMQSNLLSVYAGVWQERADHRLAFSKRG